MVKEFLRAISRRKIDVYNSLRISHSLYQQQKKGRFCDLKVVVEEREYFVHKCVIASASKELDKLIADRDTLQLEGVSRYGFERALEILYTGKMTKIATVDAKKLRQVVIAADVLNAESVLEYCSCERSDLMPSILDSTMVEERGYVAPTSLGLPATATSITESVLLGIDDKVTEEGASAEGISSLSKCDEIAKKTRRDSAELLYESIAADVEIGPGFCKALSVADQSLTPAELEDLLDRPIPQTQERLPIKGSEKMKCSFCDLTYLSSASLRIHLKTHATTTAGVRPLRCNACGMSFSFKIALLSHMKLHQLKKNVCTICGKDFKSKKNLQAHMENIHTGYPGICTPLNSENMEGPRPKRVKSWGRAANEPDSDQLSEFVHDMDPDEDGKFFCPICDKGFSKRWNLKCHVLTHTKHFRETNERCSPRSPSRSLVTYKPKSYFLGEKECECSICGSFFATSTGLKKHKTFMHLKKPVLPKTKVDKMHTQSEERQYCCTKCGSFFATISGLRKHDTHMHIKREYTLEAMHATKRGKKSRPLNQSTYSELAHWCKICGKGFKIRRNLKSHMGKHTGSRYECPICQRRFAEKNGLNGHLWVHGGQNSQNGTPAESADRDASVECDGSPEEAVERERSPGKLVEHDRAEENSVEHGTSPGKSVELGESQETPEMDEQDSGKYSTAPTQEFDDSKNMDL